MIDFDALASTPLQRAPYEWALTESALDGDRAAELIDLFPTHDFWQIAGHDGEKSYAYDARPLVICGSDRAPNLSPLPAVWQEVVEDLLSPRYREALGAAIGRSLDGALMEANVWRWPHAAHLGPHLDMKQKIVTHIFYLNAGWNLWWGGCLRILNSQDEDDLVTEIPPRLGNASIVVRSDRSWHAVSPVGATAVPRRSLIVTWFHPGNESPTWYEDSDGTVRTFAEPPGAIPHETPLVTGLAALEAQLADTDARAAELTGVRRAP
jgi:SM-20-related protein